MKKRENRAWEENFFAKFGKGMSKIGKMPIKIIEGTEVKIQPDQVSISGPKGTLVANTPKGIKVEVTDGNIVVSRQTDTNFMRSLHGATRANLSNMVRGVTTGFEKTLVLQGVGYRARLEGSELYLMVGFSHPVKVVPPEGIKIQVSEDKIIVSGIDKQLVGETASKIRRIRPPEPYKGKGIRYLTEHIRRKAGKKAVATGQ